MEWLRWQRNPWGQEVLRGLSWDTAWLAVAAGLLFVGIHTMLYYWRWRKCIPAVRRIFWLSEPAPGRPGKNPLENKLFHHVTSIATLAVIVTGLLMMVKVDTPIWTRNPYLLADEIWGVIYAVHGLASVVFITLIITHIYFAVRPEKRWITLSMIVGWIPRDRYVDHHDPERWPVGQQPSHRRSFRAEAGNGKNG